jgi:hypothetical protein
MSVNGSGIDRKTNKPANDGTNWTVKTPDGTVLLDQKQKPLTGLNATDAFNYVRSFRQRRGVWAVAVRG